jgi:AraC-like DNA-binding protein
VFDTRLARRVGDVCDAVREARPASLVESRIFQLFREFAAVSLTFGVEIFSAPIAAARDRLHANLAKPPSMLDLGRAAQRSPYHLIRTFGREVGLTPHAYFDQIRVAHAKERLILGQKLSLTAYELGYCDQSHFTRAFKKTSLVTPGKYLQMVNNGRDMIGQRSAPCHGQ